uniref:NADH-ubiquinone oxidoreductase chain 6 n=1 Tax=Kinyongia fischeri TaxID=414978 RepID=B7S674_KINFI|nr:NADH dehydrogenase subunit 6 [Kinyongia fischeri]ABM90407.1 NADH dehydrogenase subunit 6 [Kinyongia fischeri]
MYFFLVLWLFLFFMGGVACNPSPFFGTVALVLGSVFGAGVLAGLGHTFLSLALVLAYLGGMLVAFAFSVSLSSDLYPEAWGSRPVMEYIAGILLYLVSLFCYVGGWWVFDCEMACVVSSLEGVDVDLEGVILLYSIGGVSFFILGLGLLLTLFVVLDLVRGWQLGAVRVS